MGDLLGPAPGDEKLNCMAWLLLNEFGCAGGAALRGAEKVNAACFNIMFSLCRRCSKSRRFSFSCSLS